MNNALDKPPKVIGSKVLHFVILTLTLFAFWLILSGLFKPQFLLIGFFTSLIVAWFTRPLLRLPSASKANEAYLAFDFPYGRFFAYLPWLILEIFLSAIDVVRLVLDPKMPIAPKIITFKKTMSNPFAHVLLANSITLTPGTLTLDVEDGVYTIHVLSEEAARALAPEVGEGDMIRRIGLIFDEQPAPAKGELNHDD